MKSTAVKLTNCLLLPMAVLLAATGCSKNPQAPDQLGSSADRAAIQQTIQGDDLFNSQGFDDEGAQAPTYDNGMPKTAEAIEPIKYGRRGMLRLETVDIEFTTDTTAIATVVHSLNGRFFILAENNTDPNAVGTLYSKEMENTILRKAKLVKVRNTGNERHDWRVTEVSGCVASSPGTTISISEMTLKYPDGSTLTVTDPLSYFMSRETGLPEFDPGDSAKVFVKLSNTNEFPPLPGETVLLRHAMDHRFHRARKPFNDEGIYPDEVAGDGIYSGAYRIGPRRGLHHGGIDTIDNGTIYDNVAPYNTLVWSLPYLVRF